MSETLRLDKWLWHARFARTRSLAAKLVSEARFRINGNPTEKEDKLITNAMITPEQYAVVETCGVLYREQLAQPETVEDDEAVEPGPAKESPFAWDTPPAQGEK